MPPRRNSYDTDYYPPGHARGVSPNATKSGKRNNSPPPIYSSPPSAQRMVRRLTNSNTTAVNQANISNTTIVNQANTSGTNQPSQPQQPPGCFTCIIEDNNPLVHYEGVWVLSGTQFSTTHSTTLSNSSISLRFNGSGVVVFGTVPASNGTTQPPTAVYFLDNYPPFQTTLPRAHKAIPNQPLFASSQPLLSDQEHHLVIEVRDAATPYTVEKFFVAPRVNISKNMIGQITTSVAATDTVSSTTSSATLQNFQTSGSSRPSQISHKVLGAVMGTVCLLLLAAVLGGLVVWRKRRAARKVACPAAAKARPDTIYTSFTSTESILRNDSGLWSPPFRSPRSQYSRSEGRSYAQSASDGQRSTVDAVPPPLPPKPILSTS